MAACRSVQVLPFIFFVLIYCFAQDVQPNPAQTSAPAPEKVLLKEVSTVQVPSLPAASITAPVFCDPDGSVLFRLATPDTGVEDPVSVSSDGKTVIRFGKEKINDISRPSLLDVFLGGSIVYILTRGSVPLGYETKRLKPNGEVQTQPATKSTTFVAHFERDGRYAGAVRVDIPFSAQHLGVFEDGDFLITGADLSAGSSGEPRLAIVASNGQLLRLIELKGDVHAQEDSPGAAKEKGPAALPRFEHGVDFSKSLLGVVSLSHIAKNGSSLLLLRPGSGPIFSIAPSGEVRVHRLKVKGGYNLFTVKATRNSWIVEYLTDVPIDKPAEFLTYAFDAESGAPLREYFFPTDLGFGLACTDGDEFTFVMANEETNTLRLVKLAPEAAPKSN
jgi:hypothetical protein